MSAHTWWLRGPNLIGLWQQVLPTAPSQNSDQEVEKIEASKDGL